MDIRHLRNMLAVMEDGSLGKAALRLNISQPALTKSIQRLEEHLGVRLFERESRGMKPTFYADSLRNYAKAASVGMAEAERRIAALRNGTEGLLTVAAPPQVATEFLPRLLVELSSERPKLQIRIVTQNKNIFGDLLDGYFDLVVGILYENAPDDGLRREWLFDDKLVVVMRVDHPLAGRQRLRFEDLLGEKWLLSDANNWSQRRLRLFFEQAGLPIPVPHIQCRDPAVLKSIVSVSDYITVVARLSVESDLRAGKLAAIELPSPLLQRPVGIVRRAQDNGTPAVRSFIETAKNFCRSQPVFAASVDTIVTVN